MKTLWLVLFAFNGHLDYTRVSDEAACKDHARYVAETRKTSTACVNALGRERFFFGPRAERSER